MKVTDKKVAKLKILNATSSRNIILDLVKSEPYTKCSCAMNENLTKLWPASYIKIFNNSYLLCGTILVLAFQETGITSISPTFNESRTSSSSTEDYLVSLRIERSITSRCVVPSSHHWDSRRRVRCSVCNYCLAANCITGHIYSQSRDQPWFIQTKTRTAVEWNWRIYWQREGSAKMSRNGRRRKGKRDAYLRRGESDGVEEEKEDGNLPRANCQCSHSAGKLQSGSHLRGGPFALCHFLRQ